MSNFTQDNIEDNSSSFKKKMTMHFFLQVSYSTARPSLNHTACKVGIALCELVCQALLYQYALQTSAGSTKQERYL